jgi:ankyrin repeat protein
VVRYLIKHGADVNTRNKAQQTPLILAAHHGDVEVNEALMDAGAEMEAEDGNGWTALTWASYREHDSAASILISRGADTTKRLLWMDLLT